MSRIARYNNLAAAGAAGGSTVPTGPVIGLECVCTFACLFNCSCYGGNSCFMDMQGYAYGDKQWLGVYYVHPDGSTCRGTIGIMHYDDESCWARKTWSTNTPYTQGGCQFLYIHPISGWMFALAKGCSGIAYINGGPDSSTNPNSFGIESCLGTTGAGGLCAVAAVGDCAIHQNNYYNGYNIGPTGPIFCCNYVPAMMGGYCDANCCFFWMVNTMCYTIHVPRQCNGAGPPTETDAGIFAHCFSFYCYYRPRGKAAQFFTNEDGQLTTTQYFCRQNSSTCYLMCSNTAYCYWNSGASGSSTSAINGGAWTGCQMIYNVNNCCLMAGSCKLCCPGTSTPWTVDNGRVGVTVLRDRVYFNICDTLYRGII